MEDYQGSATSARRRTVEASEYSIQDVSEKLGIPIQKLRRWDDQGVLVARRTDGGHRRYSKELIDRLIVSSGGNLQAVSSEELETVKRSLDEKRRIIQLLLESEQRYRDLVETTHDLIWTTDSQGHFTYLNAASRDVFGLSGKELQIGRAHV
jgi:PAS domain-containing protein